MVEALDHDAKYLEDYVSNYFVLRHVLLLEQLVAAVGDQTVNHKLPRFISVQYQKN